MSPHLLKNAGSWAEWYDVSDLKTFDALNNKYGFKLKPVIEWNIQREIKHRLFRERSNRYNVIINDPITESGVEIFYKIFKRQGVDPREFCNNLYDWANCTRHKLNTIKLWGAPNTCKSLISLTMASRFVTCYCTNHGSLGDFFYAPMLNKSIINLEELQVTCATADDFKSILGGATIDFNEKHTVVRQRLTRTPVVVTSNWEKFGRGMISCLDENALNKRCFSYMFNQPIDIKDITSENIDSSHFAAFVKHYGWGRTDVRGIVVGEEGSP